MIFKYFNKQKHKKDTSVRIHLHNCYEFVYCSYGSGIINIAENQENVENITEQTKYFIDQKLDKSLNFYDSSTFIIPPGMIHNEIYLSENTELVSIGFIPENNDIKFNYFTDENNEIQKTLSNIEYEFKTKHAYYIENINSYMTICINQSLRYLSLPNTNTKTHNIDFFINYINEYYNTTIDIDLMSHTSGYSDDHFRYLFKKKTGSSPHQYIIKKRLNFAKDMILNTNKPLIKIAELCGYDNYYQFITIFKKYYGCSPSKYRKSIE